MVWWWNGTMVFYHLQIVKWCNGCSFFGHIFIDGDMVLQKYVEMVK